MTGGDGKSKERRDLLLLQARSASGPAEAFDVSEKGGMVSQVIDSTGNRQSGLHNPDCSVPLGSFFSPSARQATEFITLIRIASA